VKYGRRGCADCFHGVRCCFGSVHDRIPFLRFVLRPPFVVSFSAYYNFQLSEIKNLKPEKDELYYQKVTDIVK